ncbi:tyrocidine synthetase 1 [Penicillium coprophilum]|uniref:tyrocidine synthetase 1 n=1 Tax=Penicillium coprophilum TaxID=36646 RepID=UPI0023872209|nr:tyrocidine synthetase 1 [Penicillium coprophilum]KAJ5178313.1 tyrocidine synthetase 1 [Penicillium coprophilum]
MISSKLSNIPDSEQSTLHETLSGLLHRLLFARAADDRYTLVLTMHHAIIDGWSLRRLMADLRTAYANKNLADGIPASTILGEWSLLDKNVAHIFWSQYLATATGPDTVKSDVNASDQLIPEIKIIQSRWPCRVTSSALSGVNRNFGVTSFTIVWTLLGLALPRTNKTKLTIFWTTSSGRADLTGGIDAIGNYLTSILCVMNVEDDIPIEQIRSESHSGLTQHILGRLQGACEKLCSPATSSHTTQSLAAYSDGYLERPAVLSHNLEVQQQPSPSENLVSLFVEAAKQCPNCLAPSTVSSHINFAELDYLMAKMTRKRIQAPGNWPRVVASFLDRRLTMIIAIIAALRAGMTYCSLEYDTPSARLNMQNTIINAFMDHRALAVSKFTSNKEVVKVAQASSIQRRPRSEQDFRRNTRIAQHHKTFRTTFDIEDDTVVQKVVAYAWYSFEVGDLKHSANIDEAKLAMRHPNLSQSCALLKFRDMYENPTVTGLASILTQQGPKPVQQHPNHVSNACLLQNTPILEWIFRAGRANQNWFNQGHATQLADFHRFIDMERAWQILTNIHPMLRVQVVGDGPEKLVATPNSPDLRDYCVLWRKMNPWGEFRQAAQGLQSRLNLRQGLICGLVIVASIQDRPVVKAGNDFLKIDEATLQKNTGSSVHFASLKSAAEILELATSVHDVDAIDIVLVALLVVLQS